MSVLTTIGLGALRATSPLLAAETSPLRSGLWPSTTGEPPPTGSVPSDDPPARARAATSVPAGRLFPLLAALRQAATIWAFAEPERARSLLFRARAAPWLPELRVRVDRRFGRTESLDAGATTLPSDTTTPVGLDTVDDVRYEVRATWDLGRLVFNPDEIQAQNEALRMADVRREVEGLVVKLFFEWQRLLVGSATPKASAGSAAPGATGPSTGVTPTAGDTDDPPPRPAARQAKELRRLEIEAELDALTQGLFSRLTRNPMELEGGGS
jgi:hypothetical protein